MLTNPMETQVLRSMDVRVGGQAVPNEPMHATREMLSDGGETGQADRLRSASDAVGEAKCPFAGVVGEMFGDNAAATQPSDAQNADTESTQADGAAASGAILWTPEARERIERIPRFVRPMVVAGVEEHARQHGHTSITPEVLDRVRSDMGM